MSRRSIALLSFVVGATATCTALAQSASTPPKPAPDPAMLPYSDTSRSVTFADGRTIHLVCMGTGSPTVIFTSGLGDWSATWSKVQPVVARKTRTCAWDRAGVGFSDASPAPQTVDNTTADLEAALMRGGIKGPYVLVGHSLGGYESLLFADRHSKEVAGMVLVDPSVPDQFALMAQLPELKAAFTQSIAGRVTYGYRCAARVRGGALTVGAPDPEGCLSYPPDYPPVVSEALVKRDFAQPGRFDTQSSLADNFEYDAQIVINPKRHYGDIPLVVLTATEPQPAPPGTSDSAKVQYLSFFASFQRAHDALAALSTRGVNRMVPGTSLYIHRIKPQVVIDTIEEVINQARAGRGKELKPNPRK
jgi:pimeloyl-ACP methyl ester carboxylesterase